MHSTNVLRLLASFVALTLHHLSFAYAEDYAIRDPLCDNMRSPATDALDELRYAHEVPYFRKPIPTTIHHI